MVESKTNKEAGRRKTIRDDFINGQDYAQEDEILLEILLSYSIPSKDLQPLVQNLIHRFGNLPKVLSADYKELIKVHGIKDYTSTLLKAVDAIRKNSYKFNGQSTQSTKDPSYQQSFQSYEDAASARLKNINSLRKESRTGMVSKALMKETIELLPLFPESDDINVIRSFVRDNLHFNAKSTRYRYTSYILAYIFPENHVDRSIISFTKKYQNKKDIGPICFYRFCKIYPLIYDVCNDLLIENIGEGSIKKRAINDYLSNLFPDTKYADYGTRGFLEALIGAGIVREVKSSLTFSYRPISIPAFAFILHSEFPEKGMYPIDSITQSEAFLSQLWHPDDILSALYELRNRGLITKVSEIDTMRQFTTKYTLDEVVLKMVTE